LNRIEDFFVGKSRRPFPVDDIVQAKIGNLDWSPYPDLGRDKRAVHIIDDFNFKHAIAVLQQSHRNSSFTYADTEYALYLYRVYQTLLKEVDVSCALKGVYSEKDCKEYNLILTTDWMMVVTRSRKSWDNEDSTVNSFPYMGLLLAKDEARRAKIEEFGPLNVLSFVSDPIMS
jgi:ATP adenylyltransferase/5',5'''-P-1,P-4-tetraphosphate phosphorylase II